LIIYKENDEVEYQSLPNEPLVSTMNNSTEIQQITASMETMRTSVLQAYWIDILWFLW